jgi:hypothetical protein
VEKRVLPGTGVSKKRSGFVTYITNFAKGRRLAEVAGSLVTDRRRSCCLQARSLSIWRRYEVSRPAHGGF